MQHSFLDIIRHQVILRNDHILAILGLIHQLVRSSNGILDHTAVGQNTADAG